MYKILIADDESMERKALEDIIKSNFNEITTIEQAANGKRAVELAEILQPDIIIMDIKMPIMNGIDAGKEIIKMLPDCKIIMLTGFTYFSYAKESITIGAVEFLVKPASDEVIIETIQSTLHSVKMLEEKKNQQRINELKAKRAEEYLENEVVSAITFSNVDEDTILEHFQGLGIQFAYGTGVIISFKTFGNVDIKAKHIIYLWKEKIKTLSKDIRICACERSTNLYMLILSDYLIQEEEYKKILSSVVESTQDEMQIKLKLAVGPQVNQVSKIYMSFQAAKTALKGEENVNFYKNNKQNLKQMLLKNDIETQLCEYLSSKKYNEAMLMANQAIDTILEENMEPVGRIYEIIIVLSRYFRSKIQIDNTYELYSKLSDCEDKQKINNYVLEFMENLIDSLIASEIMVNNEWIENLVKYIETNYMNNITLEDMAERIGFSTYYFSKLFKHTFNENFIEYLTRIRIERAKQLLLDPSISVKQVCFAVGYSEPNYFTRVFKRTVGISPSIYQKNAI
jgi:two-component system response regulator YesN